jgi:archaellum component FlaC
MLKSLNGNHDMEVDDIYNLMNTIDANLGKEVDGVAKTTYPWKVDT